LPFLRGEDTRCALKDPQTRAKNGFKGIRTWTYDIYFFTCENAGVELASLKRRNAILDMNCFG
jgi:hypothetical protein